MPIDAAGPVKGAISPIERVLPHLTSAASLADAADGAAARFVVADAAATAANAASASTAAIAIALLLIRTPPLDFTAPALLPTLCDETPGYLLSSYTRFAGESEGWNTPRMCMGSGPTFSMQCTFSGGRWKQEPGRSGMDWPPTWATPSPFTMYPSSSYGWLWKGALLGWTIPMNCVTSRQPASSLIRYRKVRSTEAVSSGWSSKRTVTLRLSPATGSSARAATATTSSSPGPGLSTEYLSPGATKTLVPGSSAWRLPSSSSSPRPATT